MLDRELRVAILELYKRGHGARRIARALKISRTTVRRVLGSGDPERADFQREELLDARLEQVQSLFDRCEGNLVRVHEELVATGIDVAYPTVTAFCRRHKIGVAEKRPAGRYTFAPGQEMQHDTSPHDVTIGGSRRRLQCASLVFAFSRMMLAQLYPTFDRFYAKAFLTEALAYVGGVARDCMVDNTHVVVASGTGKNAVIAPETAAFGDRFDFTFKAHEKGDANRSARVERPFDYIENNFYAGRTFADLRDANAQLKGWCDKVNGTLKRSLHARPIDLHAVEKPHLRALPDWYPVVVRVLTRRVDVEE
jgi:transposase